MSEYPTNPHDPAEDPRGDGVPSYPTYQSSYGMPEQSTAPPAQPQTIQTAVRLMWAGAALSAVSMVVSLLTLGSLKTHLRQQLIDNSTTYNAHDFDVIYHTAVVAAVVGSLIAIALWFWMAWKNGQGRRWARIVATVLGGINLLSSLYAVLSGNSIAISMVLTVLNLILAITILVFLWQRDSSEFYAATARHRIQYGG
jgi:hypothetical protein